MYAGKKRPVVPTSEKARVSSSEMTFAEIADKLAGHDLTGIKSSTVDMVNSPPHYTAGGIETIDFIEAKGLNYNLGQVVKYISRADFKGRRLEDLKKAQFYLNREIKISEDIEGEMD
jgi:Protein of unknwon function (DUF3310)